MSHANARLTPHGRWLLVSRVLAGRPVAHVAKELACRGSAPTGGSTGSGPKARPGCGTGPRRRGTARRRTSPELEAAVLAARARLRCGPVGIAAVDRRAGPDGLPDPGPTRGRTAGGVRPDHRRGDPRRTGSPPERYERDTTRRAGPHRRQEARPDPRRRRLAGSTAAPRATRCPQASPDRLRLRPRRWSTTTPGWPTPRSCPTRRAPPRPGS